MLGIRPIKTVITVRPTIDEAEGAQLAEFILNGVESKPAQVHQFADVTLLERRGEERTQEFGPGSAKQDLQNCAFRLHPLSGLDSTALSRRVSFAGCRMQPVDSKVLTAGKEMVERVTENVDSKRMRPAKQGDADESTSQRRAVAADAAALCRAGRR